MWVDRLARWLFILIVVVVLPLCCQNQRRRCHHIFRKECVSNCMHPCRLENGNSGFRFSQAKLARPRRGMDELERNVRCRRNLCLVPRHLESGWMQYRQAGRSVYVYLYLPYVFDTVLQANIMYGMCCFRGTRYSFHARGHCNFLQ